MQNFIVSSCLLNSINFDLNDFSNITSRATTLENCQNSLNVHSLAHSRILSSPLLPLLAIAPCVRLSLSRHKYYYQFSCRPCTYALISADSFLTPIEMWCYFAYSSNCEILIIIDIALLLPKGKYVHALPWACVNRRFEATTKFYTCCLRKWIYSNI